MTINELKERQDFAADSKLRAMYIQLGGLLNELKKKELTQPIIESINQDVNELNTTPLTGNAFEKAIKQKQTKIIKLVEKELKIVPKNYYRTLWLALGISAFGLPIGVAIGLSLGNIGFLGIGLPIGMAIGIAVGSGLDKKALDEGRQLAIEIK
ncbi:hypothetical protein GCM10028805_19170 [Spirosoma harenae]